MEASILDLGKNVREAIDRHERVTLTRHGRRGAVIVPLDEQTDSDRPKAASLPAFGMRAKRPDMADPVAYVEEIPKSRGDDAS